MISGESRAWRSRRGTPRQTSGALPMVRTPRRTGPPGWAPGIGSPACHDRRAMDDSPPALTGLPLAGDGYPAAGGVARRPAGAEESSRANRRWWDAAAPAYLAEH